MIVISIISIIAVFLLIGIKIVRHDGITKAMPDFLIAAVLIILQTCEQYYYFEVQYYELPVPYVIINLLVDIYIVLSIIRYERLSRMEISRTSIREAFDDLPSGVCYFSEIGIPVLCNRTMYGLAYDITDGKYLKSIQELSAFEGESEVIFWDNREWYFTKNEIFDKEGKKYIEIVATDITELRKKSVELREENKKLEKMKSHMNDLVKNAAAIAREEEVLAMKMKMHDDIGSCVLASRRFFMQGRPITEASDILERWKKVIGIIQRDNEYMKNEINRFQQLQESAKGIGVDIVVNGSFPQDPQDEYLIIAALRECVTNTVKHAKGDKVYVDISYVYRNDAEWCIAEITNNGRPPDKSIEEGVGLSAMRQRIERAGGTLEIISKPAFKMIVNILSEDKKK